MCAVLVIVSRRRGEGGSQRVTTDSKSKFCARDICNINYDFHAEEGTDRHGEAQRAAQTKRALHRLPGQGIHPGLPVGQERAY